MKAEHFGGNLVGTGITAERAAAAVTGEVASATRGAGATGEFWGRIVVDGVRLEYRAFTLPDGTISVGSVYPVLVK